MAAPTVRARTAPAAGLSATSPSGTAVGDAVIVFTWEQTGAGIPTHTLQSTFVEILSHGHDDGSTDGRLSVAYKIATSSGANSYQAYTSSSGTTVRTGIIVLQVGTHSLGATAKGVSASAGATQTNNAIPNPPAVTLGNTRDWLVVAIAGWHLGSAATVTPTAPTNYGNLQHVSGSSASEVASAERSLTAAASEDPGTFGDDVAPNGTAIITVGFANPIERAAAVDGAGGISSSGEVIASGVERSVDVGATAGIATSATFFTVFERTAAVSATGGVATGRQMDAQRSVAVGAVGGIAVDGFGILERSGAVTATAGISVAATFWTTFERALAAGATAGIDASGAVVFEIDHSATLLAGPSAGKAWV